MAGLATVPCLLVACGDGWGLIGEILLVLRGHFNVTRAALRQVHEVTNDGADRDQLSSMAKQAREAMGVEKLSAVADRGYFKGEEILACHEAGITVFVPKTLISGATAAGRFGKGDLIYDAAKNEYQCPAGQSLIWRYSSVEKGLKLHRY